MRPEITENREPPEPIVADPTVLVTQAIARALKAERDHTMAVIDIIKARLDAMDEATRVLHETVTRTPTEIHRAITHIHELHTEMFNSVQTQFRERDTRSERESRDNKVAVDAAFAAQKEAAAKQDEGNAKAIDKSERATAETIKTNQELNRTTMGTLTKSLDEVKLQVASIESVRRGGRETLAGIYALAGFLASIVVLGGILAATGAFSR